MTTDEHDEQLDPLSPADEERISALLADARATEPMPADVVARLDQSLAGLAAERIAIDPVPADNVIPITRTRRHRVVAVLGAAAAVVVFGLGVGSLLRPVGRRRDDATRADSAVRARRGDEERRGARGAPTDASTSRTPDHPDGNDVIVADRAYVVRSRHLSPDLARIQGLVLPDPNAAVYSQSSCRRPRASPAGRAGGRGVLVAVRYDGAPAFVAFREPMGDVTGGRRAAVRHRRPAALDDASHRTADVGNAAPYDRGCSPVGIGVLRSVDPHVQRDPIDEASMSDTPPSRPPSRATSS